MRRHDARDGELLVYTYKEGLLSKVAHDLKLKAARFELEIDGTQSVTFTCPLKSLRVVNAMLRGREAPELLSPKDKTKIEDTLARDVLHSSEHPEVRFTSTSIEPDDDGYQIRGELTLHGQSRPLEVAVVRMRDRLEATVSLEQTDFGIKPYSALFGTLKVKSLVRICLWVPESDDGVPPN